MGKPEGLVENYLIRQCEKNGFFCRKWVSPGHNGVPDRIVIARGHAVFIELKADNGRLSPLQKITIKEMQKCGADVRVMYNKTEIDEFIAEAKKWRKCSPSNQNKET